MAKKLLRVSFIDKDGTPYHEAVLAPRVARELLRRSAVEEVKFSYGTFGVDSLTYAAVARSSRGAVGKRLSEQGGEVIVVLEGD